MKRGNIKPLLRYPGSKYRMAQWIVSQLPDHLCYCEPFFGSGAVLFHKPRCKAEVVNDLNGRVCNFFRVIRDSPDQITQALALTPWSREEFGLSHDPAEDPVEDARRFAVCCWQAIAARQSMGAGWTVDLPTNRRSAWAKTWETLPQRLYAAVERLQGVQIENRPALEVIRRFRDRDILLYCDPPYMTDVRTKDLYWDEMTDDDHREMLQILREHPGPVVLSGYANVLYDTVLEDWSRAELETRNQGNREKTEVLWIKK